METFLAQFKDLGIAGISVAALAFVAWNLIKQNKENSQNFTKEISEARLNYQSFVQDNNHTTTELVREATATMAEVKNSIQSHNEVLKILIDKIK